MPDRMNDPIERSREHSGVFVSFEQSRPFMGKPNSCCQTCGQHIHLLALDQPKIPYHPWHLRDFEAVRAYVGTLSDETNEWLIAMFVDSHLHLLSVETLGVGTIGSVPIDFGLLIHRARSQNAAGFFLVHNHPSGDPTPSVNDIRITARLAHISKECDVPLIRHYIVAEGGIRSVGEW